MTRTIDKRFAVVHGQKITKKARIEATVLNSLTPLSKTEICKILPDVSPTILTKRSSIYRYSNMYVSSSQSHIQANHCNIYRLSF